MVLCIQRVEHLLNFESALYCQRSMINHLDGRPPKRHDAIAHVLVNRAFISPDDGGNTSEYICQHGLQLDGLHSLGDPCKATHIAKHDRQFTASSLHGVAVWIPNHFVH